MTELVTAATTAEPPEIFVRRHGTVVAQFDHRTQAGLRQRVMARGIRRWAAVRENGRRSRSTATRRPPPVLRPRQSSCAARNAVALAQSCNHPALARLLNVVECPLGPMVVYAKAQGELVGTARERRADPASAYQRFASLPATRLLGVFGVLIDLHVALQDAGWVASDLYDGCLIVELNSGRLTVVDLDTYRQGPSTNTMGRMFGASRFMAPEEFELGAPIDHRTTVFTLGRLAWHFGTRLTERAEMFCGPPELAAVIRRACENPRARRYPSVRALAEAWTYARK
jgi:serine/threonine protein kinase, bacterial